MYESHKHNGWGKEARNRYALFEFTYIMFKEAKVIYSVKSQEYWPSLGTTEQ